MLTKGINIISLDIKIIITKLKAQRKEFLS